MPIIDGLSQEELWRCVVHFRLTLTGQAATIQAKVSGRHLFCEKILGVELICPKGKSIS